MLSNRPNSSRGGFTILEILLASVIGVLLLAGVYMVFEMFIKQTEEGRNAVQNGDLARAIVHRMSLDLTCGLGPLPPKSGGGVPESSSSTGTSSTSSSTTSTTTAADTGSTDSTDSSTDTTDTGTSTTEASVAADVPFQGGVFGSDKQVTIYVSRVPTDLYNPESADLTLNGADPKPDIRRVTYYLSASGGLCRQEKFLVTADGVRNSIDPDYSQEAFDLIAPEVVDVSFEYFDGSSWLASWSGDEVSADGNSVMGPPRAIRMKMLLQNAAGVQKQIEHVFPIRAAVGSYTPPPPPETEETDPTEGM